MKRTYSTREPEPFRVIAVGGWLAGWVAGVWCTASGLRRACPEPIHAHRPHPSTPPHPTTCHRCGAKRGPATHVVAADFTLPRNREATADEKKRAAVIYAEPLRQALAPPLPPPVRGSGRR